MSVFLLVAALVFFALGIIWSTNGGLNVLLKVALFGLAIWGGFLWANVNGYVVKDPAAAQQNAQEVYTTGR